MFKKLFKGKEKTPASLVEQVLQDLLEKGGFLLSMEIKEKNEEEIFVDIFGEDEGLLKTKDGRFLLALQTYLNRVVQHHFFGQSVFVRLDSGNFFEEKEQRLLDLADKLKQKALSTGRPVYIKKALSPFQRRKVHQFLTEDGEVRTSSVGEGFYKNICITPASGNQP
jgi:predicted RNA-binding protein Jag